MKCNNCGKEIRESMAYCPYCGQKNDVEKVIQKNSSTSAEEKKEDNIVQNGGVIIEANNKTTSLNIPPVPESNMEEESTLSNDVVDEVTIIQNESSVSSPNMPPMPDSNNEESRNATVLLSDTIDDEATIIQEAGTGINTPPVLDVPAVSVAPVKKKFDVRIIIAICAVVVAAGIIGVVCYSNAHNPEKLMDKGEYEKAYEIIQENPSKYSDLEDECVYYLANQYLTDGDYDNAIDYFEKTGYSDAADKLKEAYYGKAQQNLDKGSYQTAIDIFAQLGDYEDSKDKINEAKYGYILENENNEDETTYQYLQDLTTLEYEDTKTIYSNLYSWRVENIYYTSSSTSYTEISSFNLGGSALLHFTLMGGTPNESISVSVKGTWPEGDEAECNYDQKGEQYNIFELSLDNSNGTIGGKLNLQIYDSTHNKVIGTTSIEIVG